MNTTRIVPYNQLRRTLDCGCIVELHPFLDKFSIEKCAEHAKAAVDV